MAVGRTVKESGSSATNAYTTGSLTWTANTRGLVFVSSASTGGGGALVNAHTITGGSETWTELKHIKYASRRGCGVFISDITPTNGQLTITASVILTFDESMYSVLEVSGFDTTTPYATLPTGVASVTTSVNIGTVGTINSGDLVLFGCGFESGADSFAVASGSSQVALTNGGAGVRSLIVGETTTDDTPGTTWASSGNGAGIVAIRLNVASGTTVSIGAGSMATTGNVFTASDALALGVGSMTTAPQSFLVSSGVIVPIGAASVATSGLTFSASEVLSIAPGTLSVAGVAFSADALVAIETASGLIIAPQSFVVLGSTTVDIGAGAILLSGGSLVLPGSAFSLVTTLTDPLTAALIASLIHTDD